LELASERDGVAMEGQETQAGSAPDGLAPQPDPDLESTEDLRRQLHAAMAQAEQYANDLSNYKRHTEAEGCRLRTSAQQELLAELGDTLRNLEQVLKADGDDVDPLQQGVAMVLKGLESVYAQHDLERIPVTGAPFDPQLHEAVLTEDSADHPPGINVREIAPGFRTTAGRVVRPARVSVARR
jgi:molecular chaperone GrpE